MFEESVEAGMRDVGEGLEARGFRVGRHHWIEVVGMIDSRDDEVEKMMGDTGDRECLGCSLHSHWGPNSRLNKLRFASTRSEFLPSMAHVAS